MISILSSSAGGKGACNSDSSETKVPDLPRPAWKFASSHCSCEVLNVRGMSLQSPQERRLKSNFSVNNKEAARFISSLVQRTNKKQVSNVITLHTF